MTQSDFRPFNFLGLPPEYSGFVKSKVVILPLQSTNTPNEIISASRNVELQDEESGKETYKIGIHTLEEITDVSIDELYKVSREIIQAGKFVVTLGGLHETTSPLVKAQLEKWPSMKVLQIDSKAMQQAATDAEWFVKVVDDLPEHVYFSIDINEINQDESRRIIDLTRELTHRRNIVGLDLVGLCTKDDQALLCARLIYKIVAFIF